MVLKHNLYKENKNSKTNYALTHSFQKKSTQATGSVFKGVGSYRGSRFCPDSHCIIYYLIFTSPWLLIIILLHHPAVTGSREHCVTRDTGTKQWPEGVLLGSLRGAGTPQGMPPSRYLTKEREEGFRRHQTSEPTSAQRCVSSLTFPRGCPGSGRGKPCAARSSTPPNWAAVRKTWTGKEDSFVLHLVYRGV